MKLAAGNISSNSMMLGWLTAPTELARQKGNVRTAFPIVYNGVEYADVETAYQKNKPATLVERTALMTHLLVIRFIRYPATAEAIKDNGGVPWLNDCEHRVTGNQRWEGAGRESRYIRCLIAAYRCFMEEQEE